MVDCLDLAVCRVLLESVEDNRILCGVSFVLLEKYRLDIGLEYLFNCLIVKDFAPFDDRGGTLDGDNFTRILVFKVLYPGLEHLGSQLAALVGLEILLCYGNLFGKVKD